MMTREKLIEQLKIAQISCDATDTKLFQAAILEIEKTRKLNLKLDAELKNHIQTSEHNFNLYSQLETDYDTLKQDYKALKKEQTLNQLRNIKQIQGMIPYDGDYANDDHNFRWFKLMNQSDLNCVCDAFRISEFDRPNIITYPEWICIEEDDHTADIDFDNMQTNGCPDEIRVTTLSESKASFEEFLDCFEKANIE